jgi:hypothetical protein
MHGKSVEKKRNVSYKREVIFGLAKRVKKKHYRAEHLHACGWVVKLLLC